MFTEMEIGCLFRKLIPTYVAIGILKEYLNRCAIQPTSDEYLFRAMSFFKSKSSQCIRKKNKPIGYSTVRSNMLSLLAKIGLNEKLFGLHSLRSGGATAAQTTGLKIVSSSGMAGGRVIKLRTAM